ncbi:DUF2493 domain-containing protein [Bacillus nakamurai]|uniref:DUF2493 domain-containing protein n=1 Tax=Bacillus nakamurai TaxID=1793963 RepID=UPI0020C35F08|nr:DUF2493 domain-containing protein [Bacillus nakamurai]MCP6682939.1 DUF2493 domain-containing protein [Bacillus nakamurai]
MIKVVVAGGRDFNDYDLLRCKLDSALRNRQNEKIVIVSGKARGADSLGERYARERGYEISEHPADWDKFGKAAGYIRNKEMAEEADALMAFWDGKSRGTKHMIDLAKKNGLKIAIVYYGGGRP